jgi:hypothetical protein
VLGYGDQALADLRDADTPIETIIRRFDVGDQPARSLLAGAGRQAGKSPRGVDRLRHIRIVDRVVQ